MKSLKIYDKQHQWFILARDDLSSKKIIDTNQYMVRHGDRALLIDPGGVELFAPMLSSILRDVPIAHVTDLFASHQDPDIISSLGLWDQVLGNAKLHGPWLWEGFIRHFGMENIEYVPVRDDGGTIELGGLNLQIVPAHYLHSSGNIHIYDKEAKIFFSGDVGAALEDHNAPMYVDDFESHIPKMEYFHQRWMPSNRAKSVWVERVSRLDIDMMVPQHGRIFKGDDVKRFLNWFDKLAVGIGV